MLAHSPRDRSRSPHGTNGTSHQDNTTKMSKIKKENESHQRQRNLKTFIQRLIHESSSISTTYDEQVKALENACIEEYRDLSIDRIRRMIRSVLKVRKVQSSATTSFLHQDSPNTTNDRFKSNENSSKKNRSNLVNNNNSTTKAPDLILSPTSTLSTFDADFLRHAFSQQFRPSLDLSTYFSAAPTSNGNTPASPLFRPNFSPSNFLQALTNTPPVPPLIPSHTNGTTTSDSSTTKSAKQSKLSHTETSSIKVLVNAYREAASYLSRSADELEQLI